MPEELTDDRLGMVFTTTDLTGPDLISQPLGVEHLFVNLDRFLPQANQTAVSFKDLADCPLSSSMTSGRGRT
ncbi:hypothetical protein HCZ00_09455 [Limosilactobacillus fermentum]|uniref:hypothetical protein n=1 Tax=Limosilactobacillus fermentum TaxID=1613 RepID=UPI00187EF1E7|nr:hypothetical protein [Limosilactobacillus fermentum]MBE8118948.1 hypothetical protein [Limosilactobacillus fermentum]